MDWAARRHPSLFFVSDMSKQHARRTPGTGAGASASSSSSSMTRSGSCCACCARRVDRLGPADPRAASPARGPPHPAPARSTSGSAPASVAFQMRQVPSNAHDSSACGMTGQNSTNDTIATWPVRTDTDSPSLSSWAHRTPAMSALAKLGSCSVHSIKPTCAASA